MIHDTELHIYLQTREREGGTARFRSCTLPFSQYRFFHCIPSANADHHALHVSR